MGTIWAIYRVDLHRAHRSLVTSVVIFGLVVVPPLFMRFDMIASWDSFGNTKSLHIAITNAGTGYRSDLVSLRINIGDSVVSALCKSGNFDWVTDSEDAATEGTCLDEYHTAIVIPSDFSRKMFTPSDGGTSSAPMTYYVDEKKSSTSPKIAGQGAEAVSAQVNQIFVQALSEVVLDTVTSVGGALSVPAAINAVTVFSNRVQTVTSCLCMTAGNTNAYTSLVGSSMTLINLTVTFVDGLGSAKGPIQSVASSAQAGASDPGSVASAAVPSVSDAISSFQSSLPSLPGAVESVYVNDSMSVSDAAPTLHSQAFVLDTQTTSFTSIKTTPGVLSSLPASQSPLDRLQDASDRLTKVANGLRATASELDPKVANTEAGHVNVSGLIAQARSAADGLSPDYETNLWPQLESSMSTLASAQSSLSTARTFLEDTTSTALNSSRGACEGLAQLRDNLTGAATGLREAAGKLDSLHVSISEAFASGDSTTLGIVIGNSPGALIAATAAPVDVERAPVYPVASFGSQMASLYTILVLWVGSILMVASLRSDVTDSSVTEGLPEGHLLHAALTTKPVGLAAGYPGHYLIFGTITLTRTTLVGLGDLYSLKVQHVHPLQLMGTLQLTAVVFSFLLYTLITAFGNAGRALGVLLLVLQISDAGRAFLLVTLPSFFSSISSFLPVTHVIMALRVSITGYAGHEHADAMWFLTSFTLSVAFLGLALRPLLVRKNRCMVEKLESAKLLRCSGLPLTGQCAAV